MSDTPTTEPSPMPAYLADTERLPADFQNLLMQHKILPDDPIITILAWHWLRYMDVKKEWETRIVAFRQELEERTFSLRGMLDAKMQKIQDGAENILALHDNLVSLKQTLELGRNEISQKIESDLTATIQDSVQSCQEIQTELKKACADIEASRTRTYYREIIAYGTASFALGVAFPTWTYIICFLHH